MVGKLKKLRTQRIELNGWKQQYTLRCLCYAIPLWLYCAPLAALASHSLVRLIASLSMAAVCIAFMLAFSRNRMLFAQRKLTLPGFFNSSLSYDKISKVRLNDKRLVFEQTTKKGIKIRSISIANLTRESATHLWSQLATKLVEADIDSNVRSCLRKWIDYPPTNLKNDITKLRIQNNGAQEELNLAIDLKAHRVWTKIDKYIEHYQRDAVRVWCFIWLGLPFFVLSFFASLRLTTSTPSIFQAHEAVSSMLQFVFLTLPATFIASIASYLVPIFSSYLSAAIVLMIMPFLAVFIYKTAREADSALISNQGIYLLRQTSLGTATRKQISWQNLESIQVVRKSANLIGKKLEYLRFSQSTSSDQKKQNLIDIPLRAFASHKSKEQLLEAIYRLAPAIEVDSLVLKALAPNEPDSYTELWLSSFSSAPQLEELTPLSPGAVLQHHQLTIKGRLASGGQAVAYLATWPQQEQLVVLKETILPIYVKVARESVLAKFERDAKLLQALDHCQIVKLHDYFIEDHRAFLMLDYVEGMTLAAKVKEQGALDEQQTIHLLEQMLDILSYLHNRPVPVVHRDFTPDNLLINKDNKITLIDFDVAMIDEQSRKNKATIVGKQNYLPPEQFRGKPTIQSDIYAMGGSLFFALTGKEPEALQSSHPKNHQSNLSDAIDRLVATCTEPNSEQRFKNTSEIAAELLTMRGKT